MTNSLIFSEAMALRILGALHIRFGVWSMKAKVLKTQILIPHSIIGCQVWFCLKKNPTKTNPFDFWPDLRDNHNNEILKGGLCFTKEL